MEGATLNVPGGRAVARVGAMPVLAGGDKPRPYGVSECSVDFVPAPLWSQQVAV